MLTSDEMTLVEQAAHARYTRRRRAGSQHRYGMNGSQWNVEREKEAIGAEVEAARIIGLVWVDTDQPDYAGDLAYGIQVRHSTYPHGRLLVHEEDEDWHFFILVTCPYPNYVVRGWTTGYEAKVRGCWTELQRGRPCFVVEQHNLYPMAEWPC